MWDEASAHRVDGYVANSHNVRRRIAKYYRRAATVIHPPVDVESFTPGGSSPGSYYLLVSAMVPYKRDDLAVRVLTGRGARLVVVGDGPERRTLEAAAGGRAEFRGRLEHEALAECYRGARALVYPGEEDFGITPLEANAAGRPVIAFKAGGVLETQVEGTTAVFFDQQTEAGLSAAVDRFESTTWDPAVIRDNALRFATPRFQEALARYVLEGWEDFVTGGRERPDVSA
jgi:glycosyltransferase involved in cell wall biosynthesis